jgi:hypothetical protein
MLVSVRVASGIVPASGMMWTARLREGEQWELKAGPSRTPLQSRRGDVRRRVNGGDLYSGSEAACDTPLASIRTIERKTNRTYLGGLIHRPFPITRGSAFSTSRHRAQTAVKAIECVGPHACNGRVERGLILGMDACFFSLSPGVRPPQ